MYWNVLSFETLIPGLFFICLIDTFWFDTNLSIFWSAWILVICGCLHLDLHLKLLFLASTQYIPCLEWFNNLEISIMGLFFNCNLNIFQISSFVNYVAFSILKNGPGPDIFLTETNPAFFNVCILCLNFWDICFFKIFFKKGVFIK